MNIDDVYVYIYKEKEITVFLCYTKVLEQTFTYFSYVENIVGYIFKDVHTFCIANSECVDWICFVVHILKIFIYILYVLLYKSSYLFPLSKLSLKYPQVLINGLVG